jgi:hypothetical protein
LERAAVFVDDAGVSLAAISELRQRANVFRRSTVLVDVEVGSGHGVAANVSAKCSAAVEYGND